jgi:hypothetical protein
MKKNIRKTKTQKRKTQRGGYNAETVPNQSTILYSKSTRKSKSHKKTNKKNHPKRK